MSGLDSSRALNVGAMTFYLKIYRVGRWVVGIATFNFLMEQRVMLFIQGGQWFALSEFLVSDESAEQAASMRPHKTNRLMLSIHLDVFLY